MKESTVGVTSETHQGSEEEFSNTRDKARHEKLENMADEILDKAATVLIEKAYDEVLGDESTLPQWKSWGYRVQEADDEKARRKSSSNSPPSQNKQTGMTVSHRNSVL